MAENVVEDSEALSKFIEISENAEERDKFGKKYTKERFMELLDELQEKRVSLRDDVDQR